MASLHFNIFKSSLSNTSFRYVVSLRLNDFDISKEFVFNFIKDNFSGLFSITEYYDCGTIFFVIFLVEEMDLFKLKVKYPFITLLHENKNR